MIWSVCRRGRVSDLFFRSSVLEISGFSFCFSFFVVFLLYLIAISFIVVWGFFKFFFVLAFSVLRDVVCG